MTYQSSENRDQARRYVFGPVPSRRMGLSLGLDLAPPKTCTLDCLYCEVGRTTHRTITRFPGHNTRELIGELTTALHEWEGRLDYVTLAGSGEPTLNLDLGLLISEIKGLTDTPVAVLTNGTLLWDPAVREELGAADLVAPSLDTVVASTFGRLNRPHPDLDLEKIIDGLRIFRSGYSGRIWLEVLVVAGYNDGPREIEALKRVTQELQPDLIQVNTVFRPPAYPSARGLGPEDLERLARELGPRAVAVGTFHRLSAPGDARNLDAEVLAILGRRPCTALDLAGSLGLGEPDLTLLLERLEREGRVVREFHGGDYFYRRTV